MSCAIGDACASMPIPAVTFVHSTSQSSQNCGVLHAVSTATCADVTSFRGLAAGTNPAGVQPARGTRTMAAPKFIIAK
jgi:hypothetical protein